MANISNKKPLSKEEALVNLETYSSQIWTCVNCYCGLCVEGCPVFRETRNESGSARGLALMALAYIKGELSIDDLKDEFVYGCTGCSWCEWTCSLNTPLFIERNGDRRSRVSGGTIAEILRSIRAEKGNVPKSVRDALTSLYKLGNPYGRSKKSKDKWVSELQLDKKTDVLFYVGATVPFEERAKKMAESVVELLKLGNINICMIGSEEMDSGAMALMMGGEGIFEVMNEHTEEIIKKYGFKQIICLSPHDYDAFKAYYPAFEGIEIKHYTQILLELLEKGKLKPQQSVPKKITYHDPCYLGRKNETYDSPRKVLQTIPGVELLEMKKTRQEAYCCGGGGTGLFYELPNIKMNQTRVDHAKAIGADHIIVACPICYQMLEDGVKSKNYKIEVTDVAGLLLESVNSK